MEKISFAIDNIELVKEDPDSSFSILSLDFFASGQNLHNMYVSEETLDKTADTIKNCPVVWKLDILHDDIGNHDPEEVPCGFIPESSEIIKKRLSDGRIMLSTVSYIWKKYSGKILDFFKKNNERPVSVEMTVFDSQEREDEITELLDYKFEAVTVLGNKIQPAIPLARSTVLQFAKDYEQVYNKEFQTQYDALDFMVPKKVKENAQEGLSLHKEHGRGGNSVSLSLARHLANNEKSNSEKIRHIYKVFSGNRFSDMDKDSPSDSYINFMLYGGNECKIWSSEVYEKINEIDSKHLAYFEGELITMPYKNLEDVNSALKGIDPPITLEQANTIAAQADAIGADEGGWGIAIKHFKDSHEVKDGNWVKKEESKMSNKEPTEEVSEKEEVLEKEEGIKNQFNDIDETKSISIQKEMELEDSNKEDLSMKGIKRAEEKYSLNSSQILDILNNALSEYKYSADKWRKYWVTSFSDWYVYVNDNEDNTIHRIKYDITDLKAMLDIKNKEEVFTDDYKTLEEIEALSAKMSLDANLDVAAILAMLEDETENFKEIVEGEFSKPEGEKNFATICATMFAKMCKMQEQIDRMAEESKTYMTENSELKEFKSEIEKAKFEIEIDATLKELKESVEISTSELDAMREKSAEFSLADIDVWKNECKAKAFPLKSKREKVAGVNRAGFPFVNDGVRRESIWDKLK